MKTYVAGALFVAALLGGCQSPPPAAYRPAVGRLYLETRPGEAGVAVRLPQSGMTIDVAPRPVFSEYDIVNAEEVQVDLGRCLMVQLTPAAARDLYRLSVGALGRRLVLSLNGRVLGARRIDRPLADGSLLLFVETPDARLPDLVARLKRTSADIAYAAPPVRDN